MGPAPKVTKGVILFRFFLPCKFGTSAVPLRIANRHTLMLLALIVASPGAFMAPGQGLSAPLRSLSASLRLPNYAAGAASVARVPAASMSSAPVGTELIDYLFFIPFALILFALGAGARSVLMGDDGLFSQVTAALTRGLTSSDTDPEPSPCPKRQRQP